MISVKLGEKRCEQKFGYEKRNYVKSVGNIKWKEECNTKESIQWFCFLLFLFQVNKTYTYIHVYYRLLCGNIKGNVWPQVKVIHPLKCNSWKNGTLYATASLYAKHTHVRT